MPEPNRRLRAAREALPSRRVTGEHMGRAELADAVNAHLWRTTGQRYDLDAHSIARWERGTVKRPSGPYRSALRHVLGADDTALGFFGPHQHSAASTMPLTAPAHDEHPGIPVSSSPNEVAAIAAVSQAFQAADRRVGGGMLYGQVMRYLNAEVGPKLLDPISSTGPVLFAAAASMTEVAGWMAHDGGWDALARRHFDRAYRLASAADRPELAANVCASMSHLAAQLGQPSDAVRIAEAGLTRARNRPGTSALRARLHAMAARGYSLRGEMGKCSVALAEADKILTTPQDDGHAEWLAGFDSASLASEAALCLRVLGKLDEAEQRARQVIELRGDDRVRSRALAKLSLARVLLDAGRVDEAAHVGQQVCTVASSLTSARVRWQLEHLGTAAHAHRGVEEVEDFLVHLAHLPACGQQSEEAAWPV